MASIYFVPAPVLQPLTRQQLMSALLTREQMEQRRLQAAELLSQGLSQGKVARRLYVSRTTTSRWAALLRQGQEALRRRHPPGRPCRLNAAQRQKLRELYLAGPGKGQRWTCYRLRDVILERFGVPYDVDHVGRILNRLRAEAKGAAQ
jgi:transposase